MSDALQNLRDDHSDFDHDALDNIPEGLDPFTFFCLWLDEAVKKKVMEPNAMSIATLNPENLQPSSRIVYLKEFFEQGLVFYTNYNSQKALEILKNPHVALHFFWPELQRQVRIQGMCKKAPTQLSDKYFESRPRQSQLGAWASDQSQIVEDRQALVLKADLMAREFPAVVPRPEFWGGFVVQPNFYEFWQGRPNRLHDRICFEKSKNSVDWKMFRKNP
jgi:pyridoxamine 5'-phosphate oxidase